MEHIADTFYIENGINQPFITREEDCNFNVFLTKLLDEIEPQINCKNLTEYNQEILIPIINKVEEKTLTKLLDEVQPVNVENKNIQKKEDNLNYLLSTTDAVIWAKEF